MEGNPHIIGLTGSFGSGCTTIAQKILAKTGYQFLSLSDALKLQFKKETGKDPDNVPRKELQDFGDAKRKEKLTIFAEMVAVQIRGDKDSASKTWVVDSIRNPAEIRYFRALSRNFFLFGVYAGKEERWKRVGAKYHGKRDQFETDDERDSGEDTPRYGQKVQDCFSEADVVFGNQVHYNSEAAEAFGKLREEVLRYADLAGKPLSGRQPTPREMHMAMAYAAAQRSSCLQRKVGAVVVDGRGAVISSGFNEVPEGESPCSKAWGKCFRAHSREDFVGKVTKSFTGMAEKEKDFEKLFKEHFRILDICRALHAEENAILNLARTGRSIAAADCTLYTTTYPCRLCANKIANVGFGRIVYVEPYPDKESEAILKDVKCEFFEGVTYRAYFRVYGEEKP